MASPQRAVVSARRRGVCRRLPVLLIAGAVPLLATGCGSSDGFATPCSVWFSMDNADQQSVFIAMDHQDGVTSSSSDLDHDVLLASLYCEDPFANDDTIGGMRDSRPS
jgi:hypothetical protein